MNVKLENFLNKGNIMKMKVSQKKKETTEVLTPHQHIKAS